VDTGLISDEDNVDGSYATSVALDAKPETFPDLRFIADM
tara:strand:+ start:126 stop:242 length:117 start_codon:yes stop_codon:yes gene_type:complete